MAYKDFQAAQVLTAQEVDEYLMRQSVMVFDSAAARNLAIASPTEGMMVYLKDTNRFQIYDGSAWVGFSTDGSLLADGEVRADAGGADGGTVLRQYAGGGYTGVSTNGMVAPNEFMMVSNGTNNIISGGAGGTTYIRAGNNDTSGQVAVYANNVQLINRVTMPNQPWCQLKGQGANWFQPSGPLIANGPAGFSWSAVYNVGGHWNGNAFIAPVTGVYLCIFKTYQQNFSGNGYIHWLWLVGGVLSWNGGETPYNIYGYDRATYADGIDVAAMLYVTAGNGIQIGGYMGGDERFYSNYTYMSIRLLG